MKKSKLSILIQTLFAIAVTAFAGVVFGGTIGLTPIQGAVGAIGIGSLPAIAHAACASMGYPAPLIDASLRAGVIKELWTDIIYEVPFFDGVFAGRRRDLSAFVDNGILHAADAGVYPNVLINNNTYPVAVSPRADSSLDFSLDTFDTEATVLTNVERMQSSYDKMKSIVLSHQRALQTKAFDRCAHGWSPASDDTFTPVFPTSGADRGNGFKAFTMKDFLKIAERFDLAKAPAMGRVAVLHPSHAADLMGADTVLFKQFTDLKAGQVLPIFGFDVYKYPTMAVFNKTTGVKVAFGAAAAPSTDAPSSLFYVEDEVWGAMGNIDMFAQYDSPTYKGDLVSFQMRFLALPARGKFIGAVYSVAA